MAHHARGPARPGLSGIRRLAQPLRPVARHPGRVFHRALIHEKVSGWEAESSSQGVTELVRRIRRKLAEAGADTDPIETVWG
ncbi:MAG: helix-turn-helix domain-containing protein, partial [Desulfovibrio sp.]|nr:helix-turn-helix domain-containing protein [Desulfovibrio sp.]